jgi:hypothetical protein
MIGALATGEEEDEKKDGILSSERISTLLLV